MCICLGEDEGKKEGYVIEKYDLQKARRWWITVLLHNTHINFYDRNINEANESEKTNGNNNYDNIYAYFTNCIHPMISILVWAHLLFIYLLLH